MGAWAAGGAQEEMKLREVPFVRRFVSSQAEGSTRSDMYERLQKAKSIINQTTRYDQLDSPGEQKHRERYERVLSLQPLVEEMDYRLNRVQRARSAIKQAMNPDGLSTDATGKRHANAIHAMLGVRPPLGREISDEQAEKMTEKLKQREEEYTRRFNREWQRVVVDGEKPVMTRRPSRRKG